MIALSKNIVLEKSFDFGLDIVKLYLKLKSEKEYILSNQLVRSATSIHIVKSSRENVREI